MQSASLIDLAALDETEARAALFAVEQIRARQTREDRWMQLVRDGTEREILDAAQFEFSHPRRAIPITLANRYPDVRSECEIVYWAVGSHPRRPVIMRGSLGARLARHSTSASQCANGWAIELFDRAVRASRRTILEVDEYRDFQGRLIDRITSRHRSATHVARERTAARVNFHTRNHVLIGGKFVWLSDRELENVHALHSIIRRSDKLERRVELAREHMRERLAA